MALIVGDDFQHILRVLNTNVDGREKVRQRFRFLLVREWAFGVRMRSSSYSKSGSGEAKPFWDRAGLFWVESHLETSGKDGTRLARATVLGAVGIFARANATRSSRLDARDAREAAQKAMSSFRFFLKMRRTKGSKKGESDPTRISCSSSKTFCLLTTRQTRILFSSRNRSCTLSRKSKASVVDLPTSSAKRRKSIWVKELGNSPLLNSNR